MTLNDGDVATVAVPHQSGPDEPFDQAAGPAPVVADPSVGLTEVVARLEQDLRSAIEQAGLREQVVARLHDENEKLRAGERALLLRPVQTDLQRLRNDLQREATKLPADTTIEKVRELLSSFAVSVELALERCGVAVLRPQAGAPFDPAQHRVVEALATASPELDATIAEVLGDGYLDTTSQRVMAPAPVRVWRWPAN